MSVRAASLIATDLRNAIPGNAHLAVLLEEAARRMSIAAAAETFLDTCALLERGHILTSKPANLPDREPRARDIAAKDDPPYWLKDEQRSDT